MEALAENAAVLLMQYPLKVRARMWNLARMPVTAHRLSAKDTAGSLISANLC